MKLRLAPAARAKYSEGLDRMRARRQGMEALLRTGQLILILWIALIGAQFAANGIVRAATLLAGLIS